MLVWLRSTLAFPWKPLRIFPKTLAFLVELMQNHAFVTLSRKTVMSVYKFKCLPGIYTKKESDCLNQLGFKTKPYMNTSYVRENESNQYGLSIEVDMEFLEIICSSIRNVVIDGKSKTITLGVRTSF